MLTKNACDVLAVVATNNMMNKEAGAAGRALGKLIKNLPFYKNMLKGFGRQVVAPVKGLATDARAYKRLAGRGMRHGVDAAKQYADDALKATGQYVDDAAAAAHSAATAGKKGLYNAALGIYTNPQLTNTTRAVTGGAKKVGQGALKAGEYVLKNPLQTVGTAAAAKYLFDDEE